MKTLITTLAITLFYLLVACGDDITQVTEVVQAEEITYGNTVTIILSLKGEYTVYDVATGKEVWSMYKHKSEWLEEGIDTVNLTMPDTVITYRYDHKEDKTEYNINAMENGEYNYTRSDGWKLQSDVDLDWMFE